MNATKQAAQRPGMKRFVQTIGLALGLSLIWGATPGAARQIPAEEFGKLPQMTNVAISPNGAAIAMLKPIGGKNQVVIMTLDGSSKPNVVDFETFDADWFLWINDDYVLVRTSRASERVSGGTHFKTRDSRLVSVHRTGASAPKIMMEPKGGAGVLQGGQQTWKATQGTFFHLLPDEPNYFLAQWEDGVTKVNIRTGKYNAVWTMKEGEWRHLRSLQPDMKGNIRLRTTNQDKAYYRNNKGFWKEVTVFDFDTDEGEGANVVFDKDPRYGYSVVQDDDDNLSEVIKIDFEANKILGTVFSHDFVDVGSISYNTRNEQVIGVNFAVDRRNRHYFHPAWKARHDALDQVFPGLEPRITSSTADLTKHVVLIESPFVPATYYLFDEKTNKISSLGSGYPQFKSGELAEVRPIALKARDGQIIRGYLTLPNGAGMKNLPMITMPHGGPEARDYLGFSYLAQFFANRGYAVFQPNFRGSGGYGKKFADAGQKEWGGLMSDDVTDGVLKLIELGVADPDRMCIVGWSYGGYAAQIASVVTPDLYNCAVSINGVSDLPDMLDYSSKGNTDRFYSARDYWTDHIGHRHKDIKKLVATSPARQASKIKIPMLLIHAETDRIVPVEQSRKMEAALKSLGKPVRFVEFEGGDHGLRLEESRVTAMVEMDKFLAEHMK